MALMLLPAGAGAATQAESADSFVETVGVNTHLGYDDTPYDNFAMVRQRLNELGIRYIRDGFSLNRSAIYSRVRTLAGDGIRLNVTATDPLGRWQFGTIDQQLAMIETELLPALVSIEGPNEYDIQADPNWVAVIRDHTQRLYEGIKSRPRLASLPVVGPSIVRRENMDRAGDLSAWVNYGNTHTYLSGTTPESDSVWDGEFRAASAIFGDHPWQVTETGYHNGVNGPSTGHQPASEAAAGIYMPRLFLENFRRGIVRSFSYELLDQRPDPGKTDIEANFGLLRNDFSKKPAAVALERLLGLLSDRGAGFAPQSLEYGIVGMPASGQQILLQKRDGSFYLVLWNRVSVWNTANRSDLAPADVPITVNLGQPIAGVQIYKPNVSASPIASGANPGSIELGLSAAVTIVRLTPPGGAPEPTPEPEPPKEEPKPNPEPGPQPESPSAPDSGAPPVGPIADDVVEIEEPPKTKQRAPAVPQLLEPARAETIDPVIRPAVVTSRRAPLHSPPAFCKRARARHKSRIGQTISATPQRRMQVAGQRRTSRGHIAGNCSAPRRR